MVRHDMLMETLRIYDALRYITLSVIVADMIHNFADAETEKIWGGIRSRRLPSDIQQVALRKLRLLNQAKTSDDLKMPPGNRLEALKGDRKGQYSIRINDQWRLCFNWQEGTAYDVEIVDYHR
jgi:proteic killer suppression protein